MNNPKVESESAGQALEELKNTVARLRAPEGCPMGPHSDTRIPQGSLCGGGS